MSRLFQAGGALSPDSSAFAVSVYRRSRDDAFSLAQNAATYTPQVIGSPRLSGKTTQVNTIVSYHEKLERSRDVLRILCEIPGGSEKIDEAALRTLLASKLWSESSGSLRDILRTSRRLGRSRAVVAIINSERIATSALHWLLSGFKAVHGDIELRTALKVHLLIDGSFSVDTLTSGPDSDYPLSQTYPNEFSEREQSEFLAPRLEQLKLRPTAPAMKLLWDFTAGDKYLTQVVGSYFADEGAGVSRRAVGTVGADEMRVPLEQRQLWNGLFIPATDALASLVLELALQYENTSKIVDDLADKWTSLRPLVRALAYDGGLVRRASPTHVSLRAPILTEYLRDVLRRINATLAVIQSSFSLSGVSEQERSRARESVLDILRSSARGELLTVHAGYGQVVRGGVKVNALALDGGTYTATWPIPTDSHSCGSQVWVLLWTVATTTRRHTEQQIFQIQAAT